MKIKYKVGPEGLGCYPDDTIVEAYLLIKGCDDIDLVYHPAGDTDDCRSFGLAKETEPNLWTAYTEAHYINFEGRAPLDRLYSILAEIDF